MDKFASVATDHLTKRAFSMPSPAVAALGGAALGGGIGTYLGRRQAIGTVQDFTGASPEEQSAAVNSEPHAMRTLVDDSRGLPTYSPTASTVGPTLLGGAVGGIGGFLAGRRMGGEFDRPGIGAVAGAGLGALLGAGVGTANSHFDGAFSDRADAVRDQRVNQLWAARQPVPAANVGSDDLRAATGA